MAIKMNLDTIRASIKKKFDSFDIEFGTDVLKLRNPIRLPEKSRDALLAAVEGLGAKEKSEDGEEVEDKTLDSIREIVRIVASDAAIAERFLAAAAEASEDAEDDEILILSDVLSSYMEDQQVGEASPSEG